MAKAGRIPLRSLPISSGNLQPRRDARCEPMRAAIAGITSRALAQRVDVGEAEIRITGSKLTLLRTLAASGGVVKSATNDVRSFVPKWLPFLDTYRTMCIAPDAGFQRVLEEIG